MRMPNPFRETKFSGANADREILIFLVQLTTCRIGNLTRLIHTLSICVTIHTTINMQPPFTYDVESSPRVKYGDTPVPRDVNHPKILRRIAWPFLLISPLPTLSGILRLSRHEYLG